jgi:hypothetical protein
MKFVDESIYTRYWHGREKISNCLKRLLHEIPNCASAIILTIFFFEKERSLRYHPSDNPNKYRGPFHTQKYSVSCSTTALYSVLPFIRKALLCLEVRRLCPFTLLILVVFNSRFVWGIWRIIMKRRKLKGKEKNLSQC